MVREFIVICRINQIDYSDSLEFRDCPVRRDGASVVLYLVHGFV